MAVEIFWSGFCAKSEPLEAWTEFAILLPDNYPVHRRVTKHLNAGQAVQTSSSPVPYMSKTSKTL